MIPVIIPPKRNEKNGTKKKKKKSPRHGRNVSWNTALSVSWNQVITSSKSTIEKTLEKDVKYVRS